MFERVLFAVVTTSKSAIKLKGCPARHLFPTPPMTWTFLTAASCTSFAVHCSLPPPLAVYSSCKQFCANAGAAMMAIARTAKTNENFLQQFIRQPMIFLLRTLVNEMVSAEAPPFLARHRLLGQIMGELRRALRHFGYGHAC